MTIRNQTSMTTKIGDTLTERKLRVPQIQGAKGEAVVNYCEPLATQKMGYHRLSRMVNKMEWFFENLYFTDARGVNNLHVA